jgi:hydrogenase maturation protease
VPQRRSVVVIGIGNALRRDDAAGLEIARRLRARADDAEIAVREHEDETLSLLELWEGVDAAVLVDAVCSGAAPGTVHRVDASQEPLPARLRSSSSTHAVGLAEAIELARALHRLPERVVVFGVEGRRFDAGSKLSEEVRQVIDPVAEMVLCEARELGRA